MYLVQVGEAVGVLAQSLVLAPQSVPGRDLPKLLQVDHVESTDRRGGQTDRQRDSKQRGSLTLDRN